MRLAKTKCVEVTLVYVKLICGVLCTNRSIILSFLDVKTTVISTFLDGRFNLRLKR